LHKVTEEAGPDYHTRPSTVILQI